MAGTTGLEPATSAVTGQRSDQLSYVPKIVFNNLVICHIESSVSKNSLFSLASTFRCYGLVFGASVDTTWTPKPPPQLQDQVYQMNTRLGVYSPISVALSGPKNALPVYVAGLDQRRADWWASKHTPSKYQNVTAYCRGNSNFANFSTSRRKADGRTESDPQMSKILLREGLVFPSSIRLINALS